jgi:hypothetical protein
MIGFAPKNIEVGAVYAPKSSRVQQRIRRNQTFLRKDTTSFSKIGGVGVSVLHDYSVIESPMKAPELKNFNLAQLSSPLNQIEGGPDIKRKDEKRTSMKTNKSMLRGNTFGISGANKKFGGFLRGMGQMSGKRPALIKSPSQSVEQPRSNSVVGIAKAVCTKI